MKENKQPSKVFLVSQEVSDSPSNKYSLPVSKKFLFDYGGTTQYGKDEQGVTNSASPLSLPVGFVIEHDDWGVHEILSDNFERINNVVSRPVYTGVEVSHLEGELLTILDASFTDKTQRESIKSLVRNTLWQFHSRQEKKIQAMYESAKEQ